MSPLHVQYVAELRKLSEKCEFGDYLEQALRDRLVCGLVNERVQQRLLSESELSLKKAFEIAQGMETAQKETYEMRSSTSDGDRQVNPSFLGDPALAVEKGATTLINVSTKIRNAEPVDGKVT